RRAGPHDAYEPPVKGVRPLAKPHPEGALVPSADATQPLQADDHDLLGPLALGVPRQPYLEPCRCVVQAPGRGAVDALARLESSIGFPQNDRGSHERAGRTSTGKSF